jgi:hypothetical protein
MCLFVKSFMPMMEPLRMVLEEHAFKILLHDLIAAKQMYKSRAQIIEQLNIIKEAINKLRKTDKPRIQHALNIMMTLGRKQNFMQQIGSLK